MTNRPDWAIPAAHESLSPFHRRDRGRAAARCRRPANCRPGSISPPSPPSRRAMPRTATSPPTPPWCWPRPRGRSRARSPSALLPRLKANPDVVDGAVAGPGFINLKLADSFWLERLRECLKDGVAYGDSQDGRRQEGERRIRLGQSDRPVACGARARRGGGRCARQPARQGGLRRHQGVLHQRRRRAGRHARPLDLPALQGGAGRAHRHDPRRPLSRRVPERGRRGDRQARRRALDRQARGRLAADDARLRHRQP